MELEIVIGLEIHAQISTKTKMFCACKNNSFGMEANTNVCPVCMAFPGMLPVINKEAVRKGVIAALTLNCEIPSFSKFDRKNYFYPDLPPGFQISQYDEPVSKEGFVEIAINGEKKKIRVLRLHLENDAGKLTHTGGDTLLDFNRAGCPLMEIVSYPDMHSAEEARIYAQTVQQLLRHSGSSDCDMEKGMMRFDASVSLRPKGEEKLYPRAEIKNLNSFRSLEAAIAYEVKRQGKLWEAGTVPTSEQTVGWDDTRGTTELLREKESAADYRYFPEPDLPPVEITEEQLKEWKTLVPETPMQKYERFMQTFALGEAEARFFSEDPALAKYFEEVAEKSKNPKAAASFVGTILVKRLKDEGQWIENSAIQADQLAELIRLVDEGKISNTIAKSTIFDEMMKTGKDPKQIVEEQGLSQKNDSAEIETWCKAAIAQNPQAAADVKAGIQKALGSLVGLAMKESKGQANPKLVNESLMKLLS
ncbi:MAG: Asp-tRNA(Asn)/Glu-tRNA(Gln) amidotransferase subunit GatB [Candidatus Gracilibacteria bacterium]|jgi:aspartyl-tRNA(Asn)/glutamyl-tRNA(Gln) amidotransferase subunit B